MVKNLAENKDAIFIFDREGRKYYLKVNEDEDQIIVKLIYRENEIGRLSGVFYPDGELRIGDIIIYDNIIHKPSNVAVAFWRLLFKPKPINYRRIGLATQLLHFIIEKARHKGISRICGSLIQEDINNNPNLVTWYKNNGFQILLPSSENMKTAIYGISMDL